MEKTILCNAQLKQKKAEKIRAKWLLEVYQGGEFTVRILGSIVVELKHCIVSTSSLILTTVSFPGRSLCQHPEHLSL